MKQITRTLPILALALCFFVPPAKGQSRQEMTITVGAGEHVLPAQDTRAGEPRTRNTPRSFPAPSSLEAWQRTANQIRTQILVSNGLWPMPERTPLNARVFDRKEFDGYSVEKVYIETHPGFYLAGNLYRPVNQGSGPFPGVLNPHGHWSNGRFEDTEVASVPGRAIHLARMGMVAFSYDLVGYGDTRQVDHRFAIDPKWQLWSVGLMGLQTWNSIRALDFLTSLPDVDASRLAATGASGGGTQTFILASIDDRLAVTAPTTMVSHSMQGGCLCENAPGLRINYSNMEIAATAAPLPQILVAATGDWTRETLNVEGPAVRNVYELLGAGNRLKYDIFEAPHNYNQSSREAVYGWMAHWLQGRPTADPLPETPFVKPDEADLKVEALPSNALDETQMIRMLVGMHRRQFEALVPADAAAHRRMREVLLPLWYHMLQIDEPISERLLVEAAAPVRGTGFVRKAVAFGRSGSGDRVDAVLLTPDGFAGGAAVILAHPEGRAGYLDQQGNPTGLARELMSLGERVLLLDLFLTGTSVERDYAANHYTTYNRTDLQERVQDMITAAAYVRSHEQAERVILSGAGRAGLWSILAAPAVDAVAADFDDFHGTDEEAYMDRDLFLPGLLRMGGFEGAAMVASPAPMLIHNAGARSSMPSLRQGYRALDQQERLHIHASPLPVEDLARWIQAQTK